MHLSLALVLLMFVVAAALTFYTYRKSRRNIKKILNPEQPYIEALNNNTRELSKSTEKLNNIYKHLSNGKKNSTEKDAEAED